MPGWLVLDMELNNEGFFESQRQARQRLGNYKMETESPTQIRNLSRYNP